ncbi:MAG: cation/multidrug efflux pump [Pseudomonadota bacterium]|nr:cation/multidrug efflux pump [Pseudomonadota bacterium]
MPLTLNTLIVVLGLTAVLLFIAAVRKIRRRRVGAGLVRGLTAVTLVLIAGGAVLIAANLRTYQRLSSEQPAGELQLARIADHQFNGVFTFPSGERSVFALRGDEWQIDARVLKWQAFTNLLGFDTAYRLDRISGRYTRIDDERSLPRTVYPLNPPERVDLWDLVHRHNSWLPGIDALYGSATYVPMADGALYEVKVSQSGLMARPLNQAARVAVGNWQRTP